MVLLIGAAIIILLLLIGCVLIYSNNKKIKQIEKINDNIRYNNEIQKIYKDMARVLDKCGCNCSQSSIKRR